LAAVQDAAHQQRGVDRGQLTAEHALAAFNVDEMVEEAMLMRALLEQEGKCFFHARFAVAGAKIVALRGDAHCAQAEAGCCDGCNAAQRAPLRRRTIPNQTRFGAGFVVKEVAVATLHVVEQRLGDLGDLGQWAVDEDARWMCEFLGRFALWFGASTRRRGWCLLVLESGCCGHCGRAYGECSGGSRLRQKLSASYAGGRQNECVGSSGRTFLLQGKLMRPYLFNLPEETHFPVRRMQLRIRRVNRIVPIWLSRRPSPLRGMGCPPQADLEPIHAKSASMMENGCVGRHAASALEYSNRASAFQSI
jgi:hypothetical protein